MNHLYLHLRLNLTPAKVYALLSEKKADYYNLDTKTWEDSNRSGHTIPIRRLDGEDVILAERGKERWGDFELKIVRLSWEGLGEHLRNPGEIYHIIHAAFLLDIAERNCIQLEPEILAAIRKHRSPYRLMCFDTASRNYDSRHFYDRKNQLVYDELNYVMPKSTLYAL
jgi:hypothetical protein